MNYDNLKKHLTKYGKTDTWLNLAIQFDVLPFSSNKQRADKVRKIYTRQINKKTESSEVIVIDKKNNNAKNGIHILIPCMHVPFHDKKLLNGLLNFIKDYNDVISGFHIIGDFLDLKSLSKHDENIVDKTELTLGIEYKEGNKVLDLIEQVLPKNIQKTYIYGNHEDRYIRACNDIKNNKFADALISPEQALKLKERGFKVLNNWKEDYIQIGKYQVFHGIYCTQTPAKSHFAKLKNSCIFAHTHRVDSYYENTGHALNIGTMADLNSNGFKYVSRIERANWKNAFGIIHINENVSHADAIMAVNNCFYYGGKKY